MKKLLLFIISAIPFYSIQAQVRQDTLTIPELNVGYTTIDPRTLGGAVETVNAVQLRKGLVTSSLEALSGQAAGVQVQTGGNQEAMVSAVRVRGTTSLTGGNDPLVVIDGVTSDIATLSTIYPADIASFTILKDASETAQYGSRGASGVIQVATKKGKEGQFQISYDGNVGFESVYKNLNMLSGDEFRNAAQRLNIDIIDGGSSTNYPNAIVRTGAVQNHHIAFGGGSATSNYRVSLGYMEHNPVIKSNRERRYMAKLDVTQHAFDNRLTIELGLLGSLKKSTLQDDQRKLFYSAAAFNPTIPNGMNDKGGYDQIPEAIWITNPNAQLNLFNDEENNHSNFHVRAILDLGYGIELTAFGSYSYSSTDNAHYYPIDMSDNGEAYRADSKNEEYIRSLSLEKSFKIGQSNLKLLAVNEYQQTKTNGFNVTTTHFTTDAFGYHNLSAGAVRPWEGTGSFHQDSKLASFLLMAQYTYNNRFSLTVNTRADGSSKVGKNHRWGFFPSLSTSWTIWDKQTRRKGLNNWWMRATNYLKLRVGYGISGNLGGIDAYNSLQLLKPDGITNVLGEASTTFATIRNANPDLKWEVKHTVNVGLNAAFWDQRIAVSLDYYYSKTTDMLYLYDVPVPPFTYKQMLANLGSMENRGLEIGFGVTALRTKDTDLSIGMNLSFERNKLISLDGDYHGVHLTAPQVKGLASLYGAGYHGSSSVVMQMVGQPLGVFLLPHCTGLTTDANGVSHYELSGESRVCGQAMPKMCMSTNIAFRYRQWDIATQINGAFGHHIYNGTSLTYMSMQSLPNYNVMKSAPAKNIHDQTISDYWLERGDYIHFDYVTLGWNLPIKTKHIRNMRFSASVNNLFTITGYSGLTPLINSRVVNRTLGVDDKNCYPLYRSFSLGLSVQF